MTPNSDWWDRAKLPPRPQPNEIRKRELLATLRKGEHAVTLEMRPVYSVGEELILPVNAALAVVRVPHPPTHVGEFGHAPTNRRGLVLRGQVGRIQKTGPEGRFANQDSSPET